MRIAATLIGVLASTFFVVQNALAQKRFPLTVDAQRNGAVFSPAFSPDSGRLAVVHTFLPGDNDPAAGKGQVSRVSIWDIATRKQLQWLACPKPGGGNLVPRLVFSPDGNWLALAEYDGCIRLWNTKDWTAIVVKFPAAPDGGLPGAGTAPAGPECTATAFSPDSRQLAVLSVRHGKDESHLVWIHDIQTGKPTAVLTLEGNPAAVAWQSNDRLSLVVNFAQSRRKAHCELQEWNLRSAGSGEFLPVLYKRQNLGDEPVIAAFAPTAQSLAFATGSQIALCDLRSGEVRQLGAFGDYYGSRVPNYRAGATAMAFSPDGATLAVGGNSLQTHTRLRFFALRSQTFDFDSDAFDHGAGYAVTNVTFAPSGEYLATGVHRWAGSGEPLFLWEIHTTAD